MTGQRSIKTTVTIPEDLYLLARHYGLKNLGEFVREALQGFVDGQEEPVSDTVSMRARQIAVDLRLKSLQQRKIVQDSELDRQLQEDAQRAKQDLILRTTRAEIHVLNFEKTHLPEYDDRHFTSEGIRNRLVDEISHQCQMDLQWKDVEWFVRELVGVSK